MELDYLEPEYAEACAGCDNVPRGLYAPTRIDSIMTARRQRAIGGYEFDDRSELPETRCAPFHLSSDFENGFDRAPVKAGGKNQKHDGPKWNAEPLQAAWRFA